MDERELALLEPLKLNRREIDLIAQTWDQVHSTVEVESTLKQLRESADFNPANRNYRALTGLNILLSSKLSALENGNEQFSYSRDGIERSYDPSLSDEDVRAQHREVLVQEFGTEAMEKNEKLFMEQDEKRQAHEQKRLAAMGITPASQEPEPDMNSGFLKRTGTDL